jgi:hypothetical protein
VSCLEWLWPVDAILSNSLFLFFYELVPLAHQTWTVRVASSICSSAVEETHVQVEHDKNKLAAEVVHFIIAAVHF